MEMPCQISPLARRDQPSWRRLVGSISFCREGSRDDHEDQSEDLPDRERIRRFPRIIIVKRARDSELFEGCGGS